MKRNASGNYEFPPRFVEWFFILVIGGGTAGVGYVNLPRATFDPPDRWTGTQHNVFAAVNRDQHTVLAQKGAYNANQIEQIMARLRGIDQSMAKLGGPGDPLMPRVQEVEKNQAEIKNMLVELRIVINDLRTTLSVLQNMKKTGLEES